MLSQSSVTIIVSNNDLDKVMAAFMLASGAISMEFKVSIFFTFWGLSVLRKDCKIKVKKTLMQRLFAKILPRGAKHLQLSKMHFFGLGTCMMKKLMKKHKITLLPELLTISQEMGVELNACTMSMEMMGISQEELLDGVKLAGVAKYFEKAKDSNVNLFI